MEDFNEWSVEDIENLYAYGECAVFAVALSKKFKLPIVEFYDKNSELFHVALVIEGSEKKRDLFLDVFGISTEHSIKMRYSSGNGIKIESKTERELHQMSVFTNEDVEEAASALNVLMEKGLFPEEEFIKELTIMNNRVEEKKPRIKKIK